jgi:predicted ATPase/DNA-binding CsgD family transcriptional regulator
MTRAHNDIFGEQLRRIRAAAGLTQEQLAERAGLTVKAISALERGERQHPYPRTIQALASALRLSDDERRALLAAIPPRGTTSSQLEDERILPTLPIPSSPLLGRDVDVAAVCQLLEQAPRRLLTLTGPGGVGKTRLATHVAALVGGQFTDGVALVELAVIDDPALVVPTIAAALGLRGGAGEPLRAVLHRALQTKQLLLLLDNVEHVLAAVPEVAALLAACQRLTILATSRAPLRLREEQEYLVAPLALPRLDHVPHRDEVALSPAVQLFVQHAQKVSPDFALTQANAATVAAICRRLDGLPLAIELVAARVKLLGTTALLARLDRALPLLVGGARDVPDRQQTMRRAIGWSYDLLDASQQALFRQLGVFMGGWTLPAAEALVAADGGDADEVVDRLDDLVNQSLVVVEPSDTDVRYRLLETIRAYALEQLQAHGEEVHARDQHCAYYARELSSRTEALLSGAMPAAWQAVAADLDNVRAAWAWVVKQRDHHALARMGQSVQVIWELRGLFEESVALFRAAAEALSAAAAETGEPTVRDSERDWALGQILSLYGFRVARSGQLRFGRKQLRTGYALLQQRSDQLIGTGTPAWLGYTAYQLGAYDEARTYLTQTIDLARAHRHSFFVAFGETHLALVALAQGTDDALALAEAGMDDWRINGHPRGTTSGLWALSSVLLARGDIDRAEQAARASRELGARAQDPWGLGRALLQLGIIALARNDTSAARALVEESITIFSNLGEPWHRGRALITLGRVAHAQGKADEARVWFQEAEHIGRSTELEPITLDAQCGLAEVMRADDPSGALALLDSIVAHAATEQTTRVRAAALRDALRGNGSGSSGSVRHEVAGVDIPQGGETLTPREVEVLRLLAQGRSNQAIAQELIVALGTVKRHVNSILGKLNAQSRLEAVAHARELGLL